MPLWYRLFLRHGLSHVLKRGKKKNAGNQTWQWKIRKKMILDCPIETCSSYLIFPARNWFTSTELVGLPPQKRGMFQPALFETWGLAYPIWKLGLILGGEASWLKIWRWKAIWAICRWQNSKNPCIFDG